MSRPSVTASTYNERRVSAMAVYETRTRTIVTREVVLPSPCPWAEVSKAIKYVLQVLESEDLIASDDAAWFHARDDEIVITVQVQDRVESPP